MGHDRDVKSGKNIYSDLAEALNELPNGFPRTESGVELELLRQLVPSRLAEIAVVLSRHPRSVAEVAEQAALDLHEARLRLIAFEEMGGAHQDADGAFSLAPFFPGLLEGLAPRMDRASASLFERYMAEGGAQGIMGADPPMGRVLPSLGTAEADWVLPYDDVRHIVDQAAAVSIIDCVCRTEREALGEPCRFPKHICMILHDGRPDAGSETVSKAEALRVLEEAKDLGLVHVTTNTAGAWGWICNCCGCCCQFLRSLNDWHVERPVVRSYVAEVDAAVCAGCWTCVERCQVGAVELSGDVAEVDADRCIGCGVCVTGCSSEAITLRALPASVLAVPPATMEQWGDERLLRREP